MYSENRRVRFCEQKGQKWNPLQENGLKSSYLQSGLVQVSPCGLDAGDTLRVVSAEKEFFHHFGDALDAQTPVDDRVLGFVVIGDVLKTLREQKLENADSSRLTSRFLRRAELKVVEGARVLRYHCSR